MSSCSRSFARIQLRDLWLLGQRPNDREQLLIANTPFNAQHVCTRIVLFRENHDCNTYNHSLGELIEVLVAGLLPLTLLTTATEGYPTARQKDFQEQRSIQQPDKKTLMNREVEP